MSESELSVQIARVVRGLVAEREVHQQTIADGIGRAQSYVSVRMSGRRPWTTDELAVIARVLDMTSAELLSEVIRRLEGSR